jgi:arylsulfatase A-like enzyme
MPTFAEIAGVESPGKDGISIIPELTGGNQPKHKYLYWELQLDGWFRTLPLGGFRQAVRKGDWKAVRYGAESKIEIYNLIDDINETTNLAADHPDLVEEMAGLMKEARTETEVFPYGGKVQDYKGKDRYDPNLSTVN